MQLRTRRTKVSAAVQPTVIPGSLGNEDSISSGHGSSDGRSTPEAAGQATPCAPEKPAFACDSPQPCSVQSPAAQTPIAQTAPSVADSPRAPKRQGTPKQPSPKHPALLRLHSIFGSRLSQEGYESYEAIVSILVRRSAREPKIREKFRPALGKFLEDNRQAVMVHNKFARSYNKSFEGKHERYHLPVFENLEIGKETQTGLGEHMIGMTTDHHEAPMKSMSNNHTQEGGRSAHGWQLDGATDMDLFPDKARDSVRDDRRSTTPNAKVAQVFDDGDHHPASRKSETEDVAMMDVFEQSAPSLEQDQTAQMATNLHNKGRDEKESPGSAAVITKGSATEDDAAIIHLDDDQKREEATALDGLMQAGIVDSGQTLGKGTSHKDKSLTEHSIALQVETPLNNEEVASKVVNSDPERPHIEHEKVMVNADMTEAGAKQSLRSASRDNVLRPLGANSTSFGKGARNPYEGLSRHRSIRSVHSVQYYLAWLAHRRRRFPTAAPNSSECMLIARKLGHSSVEVYDGVMWHWGLETSSKWGDWHRQNRLQVLGEDPIFEDEDRERWQAWLEGGRDAMKAKSSR